MAGLPLPAAGKPKPAEWAATPVAGELSASFAGEARFPKPERCRKTARSAQRHRAQPLAGMALEVSP